MEFRIGLIPRPLRSVSLGCARTYRHAALTEMARERAEAAQQQERAASEPRAGAQPSPLPSRELARRSPQRQGAAGEGTTKGPRPVTLPPDQVQLRLSLMRKLMQLTKPHRTCPARMCRRHRACRSPALECANVSTRNTLSPAREQAMLANFQRALARRSVELKQIEN